MAAAVLLATCAELPAGDGDGQAALAALRSRFGCSAGAAERLAAAIASRS